MPFLLILSAAIGSLGLVAMVSKQSFAGVLIGAQLLVLGATTALVGGGLASGARGSAVLFGILIALGGVAQVTAGHALATRLLLTRNRVEMDEIKSLKR